MIELCSGKGTTRGRQNVSPGAACTVNCCLETWSFLGATHAVVGVVTKRQKLKHETMFMIICRHVTDLMQLQVI